MKYLIEKIFKLKYNDNKTIECKVELLKKAGLNVAVINKNQKYRDGYILGRMNDKHLVSEIY